VEPLSSSTIVDLWERGQNRHPIDRALLVIGAAYPDRSFESLVDLSIGARDDAILQLRRATFGSELAAFTNCTKCNERLEFTLSANQFTRKLTTASNETTVSAVGHVFRLPTSRDLAAISGAFAEEDAIRDLLQRCCVDIRADEGANTLEDWSADMIAEVEARMEEVDSTAALELGLTCAACGHTWQSVFDIASFLWEEISSRAQQLLHEVHLLARAYAWPERDILAMTDARRRLYLDLATV